MNWFLNFYFGEGPGIDKNAPKPKGLRLLGTVLAREWWELLKLNLVFIAFALPLVTLPAAWFAATSISVSMVEDRNVWLLRDFWAAFRRRFVLATVMGLLFCAGEALAILAIRTYAEAAIDQLVFAAPMTIAVVVGLALPQFTTNLFVALALRPDSRLPDLFKIAAFALLARPLPGFAALAFVAILWIVHILFYPASVLLPVLVNFSLGTLVLSFAAIGGVHLGFSHLQATIDPEHREVLKRSRRKSQGGEHATT